MKRKVLAVLLITGTLLPIILALATGEITLFQVAFPHGEGTKDIYGAKEVFVIPWVEDEGFYKGKIEWSLAYRVLYSSGTDDTYSFLVYFLNTTDYILLYNSTLQLSKGTNKEYNYDAIRTFYTDTGDRMLIGYGYLKFYFNNKTAGATLDHKETPWIFLIPYDMIPCQMKTTVDTKASGTWEIGYATSDYLTTKIFFNMTSASKVFLMEAFPAFYVLKMVDKHTGATYWYADFTTPHLITNMSKKTLNIYGYVLYDDKTVWRPSPPPPGYYDIYLYFLSGKDYLRHEAGQEINFDVITNKWDQSDKSEVKWFIGDDIVILPYYTVKTILCNEEGSPITKGVVREGFRARVNLSNLWGQSYSFPVVFRLEDASGNVIYESDEITLNVLNRDEADYWEKTVELDGKNVISSSPQKQLTLKIYTVMPNETLKAIPKGGGSFANFTATFYHYYITFKKEGVGYTPDNAKLWIYLGDDLVGNVSVSGLSGYDIYTGDNPTFKLTVYDDFGNVIEEASITVEGDPDKVTEVELDVTPEEAPGALLNYIPSDYGGDYFKAHIVAELEKGKTYTFKAWTINQTSDVPWSPDPDAVIGNSWSSVGDHWELSVKVLEDGEYTFYWVGNMTVGSKTIKAGDKIAEITFGDDIIAQAKVAEPPYLVSIEGSEVDGTITIVWSPAEVPWGEITSGLITISSPSGTLTYISGSNVNEVGANSFEIADPTQEAWVKYSVDWYGKDRIIYVDYSYSMDLETETTGTESGTMVLEFEKEAGEVPVVPGVGTNTIFILIALAMLALIGYTVFIRR